jgi:hypothetical protein
MIAQGLSVPPGSMSECPAPPARRHHTVPQFYLRGFADGDTLRTVALPGRRRYRQSVRNASVATNIYALPSTAPTMPADPEYRVVRMVGELPCREPKLVVAYEREQVAKREVVRTPAVPASSSAASSKVREALIERCQERRAAASRSPHATAAS